MSSARAQLAAAIAPLLPANVLIIAHPKEIDAIPGTVRAVIMLSRTEIHAPKNAGAYRQTIELVVIEPRTDQEGTSEDALDDTTDEIILALAKVPWLAWETATRAVYADTYPAYKFEITLATHEE